MAFSNLSVSHLWIRLTSKRDESRKAQNTEPKRQQTSDSLISSITGLGLETTERKYGFDAFTPSPIRGRFLRANIPNEYPQRPPAPLWKLDLEQVLSRSRSKRKVMLRVQIGVAMSVLMLNLIWSAWATKAYGTEGGIGTIYSGDCDFCHRLNTAFHVLINILSTILLASSNYCMQLTSAPTREEIDKAHASKTWMHVGVTSVKNVCKRSWRYRITWTGLAISSAILHLFWNSAVFTAIPTFEYRVAIATNDFDAFNQSWGMVGGVPIDSLRQNSARLEMLDNSECIDRYIGALTGGKDVIVVTNVTASQNQNLTLIGSEIAGSGLWYRAGYWVCSSEVFSKEVGGGGCTPEAIEALRSKWTVGNLNNSAHTMGTGGSYAVSHCLSAGMNDAENMCSVHFSSTIMVIVVIMNFLKCGFIILVAMDGKGADSLVTFGDAVVSFLREPDRHTANMCLATKHSFTKGKEWQREALPWKPQKARWREATSKKHYFSIVTVYSLSIVVIAALLAATVAGLKRDHRPSSLGDIIKLGLGVPDPQTLLTGVNSPDNFFATVVMANIFQLFFSCLYYSYNGLLGIMLVAAEMARFATLRKPLRVSGTPRGAQRSSYFLSVPLRYSVPLITGSAVLHWLVSQSVFLVRTLQYPVDVGEGSTSVSAATKVLTATNRAGTSNLGILLSLTFVCVLLGFLLWMGMANSFPSHAAAMPLASTCSAAISALCHRPEKDFDAYLMPVRWGVVDEHDRIGHCSFTTAKDVSRPIEGALYAGKGENALGKRCYSQSQRANNARHLLED